MVFRDELGAAQRRIDALEREREALRAKAERSDDLEAQLADAMGELERLRPPAEAPAQEATLAHAATTDEQLPEESRHILRARIATVSIALGGLMLGMLLLLPPESPGGPGWYAGFERFSYSLAALWLVAASAAYLSLRTTRPMVAWALAAFTLEAIDTLLEARFMGGPNWFGSLVFLGFPVLVLATFRGRDA